MLRKDVEGDVDSASRNAARSEWWNREGNNIERITYDNVSDPLSQKYRPSRNLFDLHLIKKNFLWKRNDSLNDSFPDLLIYYLEKKKKRKKKKEDEGTIPIIWREITERFSNSSHTHTGWMARRGYIDPI